MIKLLKQNLNLLNQITRVGFFVFVMSNTWHVNLVIKSLLGGFLVLSTLFSQYYEDIANEGENIISREYKTNAVHSLFSPFSWNREWKYHYDFFLALIKEFKIFNPLYLIGYLLILLPARMWMNYLIFYFPRTTMVALIWLSSLIFYFSAALIKSFILVFVLLVINIYFYLLKESYYNNCYFKTAIGRLTLDSKTQFFFLGNSFKAYLREFLGQINVASIFAAGVSVGIYVYEEDGRMRGTRIDKVEVRARTKANCGVRVNYEEEVKIMEKEMPSIVERVARLTDYFSKEDK